MSTLYSEQNDETFATAMQISCSNVIAIVFNATIELGLLEIISKNKEITPSELAAHLPTENAQAATMLDSMLRLLTSFSVLKCHLSGSLDSSGEPELVYQLSPIGGVFVQDVYRGRPYSLASYFVFSHDMKPSDVGYYLKDAILEGGASSFERSRALSWPKLLETYEGFSGIKSLVDVGGGVGTNLQLIASKYPSIKCINFDLPHVIKEAPPQVGIEHMEGDMFVAIPKSEAILLKFVCHNWDDEHCVKLLKKCFEAIPENGKVIIMEVILPVVPTTSIGDKYISLMDNTMLTVFGTKERTLGQFEALSKAAGFSKIQVQCCAYNNSLVEIRK